MNEMNVYNVQIVIETDNNLNENFNNLYTFRWLGFIIYFLIKFNDIFRISQEFNEKNYLDAGCTLNLN